ncbi:MAG: hypothetical protein RLZZ612_496 [Pseudomonadota bacterium]|jgi:triacylglycerol lipase
MTFLGVLARMGGVGVLGLACMVAMPAAHAQSGYTKTKYPVVLAHGIFGFDTLAGVDYFYDIPRQLRADGATVFQTQQSATQSSEVRGEQLLAELRRLKAAYGHQKFNLIGHSHGGHTVRYVAAVAPELVASVTTVGSPTQGSPVADVIRDVLKGTHTTSIAASFVNSLTSVMSWFTGTPQLPQNALAAMESLTTAGSMRFTQKFPQGAPTTACGSGPGVVNGIRYYSIGGTSPLTNVLDPLDGAMVAGSAFIAGESDGLVSRCSSRWGEVLRDNYPWNHMDEVNHSFGLRGLFTPDPVAFYRSHTNRLKNVGL